jgi:hypothetical protein
MMHPHITEVVARDRQQRAITTAELHRRMPASLV